MTPLRSIAPTAPTRRAVALAAAAALALLALVANVPGAVVLPITTLVSTGPAGGNGPFDVLFLGASADGRRVFFQTKEQLVSSDTDEQYDVYVRSGRTTTLVSTGPAGGNGDFHPGFKGASADGSRVFLQTDEKLVSADTDEQNDVYMRSGGETTLVSTGPAGGNGNFYAWFAGTSADGSRVFFGTYERILGTDADTKADVYMRSGGETTLVSTGPAGGNGAFDAYFRGASGDGSRVFFETKEKLVSLDFDYRQDVYQRSGGTTTLVSTGPAGGTGTAFFRGASADGSRVFFETDERILPTDTDTKVDVYERSAGEIRLVSTGNPAPGSPLPASGNGPFDATFLRASADGTRVFFQTDERLVNADTDSQRDIYARSGGETTLLSTGPAGGNGAFWAYFSRASADGSRVFFTTPEKLVETDQDTSVDVYVRSGGATTLVSTGPSFEGGAFDAWCAAASADGSRVFFTTDERLVISDTDSRADAYQRTPSAADPPR